MHELTGHVSSYFDLNKDERLKAVHATYASEAVLYRGQSICIDGCERYQLKSANGQHALMLNTNGDHRLRIGNETVSRHVELESCRIEEPNVFGLNDKGYVYIVYKPRDWDQYFKRLCVVDTSTPFVAIVMTDIGRLVFIK
jgi:hypothetical protein